MLLTRWGKELNKNAPLQEYPRPQFVRDSFLNLNGIWKLNFQNDEIIKNEYDYEICVPFSPETPLSGVNRELKKDEFLVYRKSFVFPEDFIKSKTFIHFGAVDQTAKIIFNGIEIGCHEGGYTPFTFEITDYIKDGENVINVIVSDKCEDNEFSRGKQSSKRGGIWYSKQSGIWQTVWIESVPEKYIPSVKITPDYDNSCVYFDFPNIKDKVKISVYDGNELVRESTEKKIILNDFKSWSPEEPFLYNVTLQLGEDIVNTYFGMRKFSIGYDPNGISRLFLNNKPYFHNGLLDQGYYPDGYLTPPANQAMEFDIKTIKECGFNMLRKHIKMEPLLWYHYCDVNGILVWQDMINGGGKYGLEVSVWPFIGINLDDTNYSTFKRTNEYARKLYYSELKEMIDNLYNCTCIALWVPFNEGWGQFDSAKAYDYIKSLDSTRIVDSTSGWHDRGTTDVISKHIYFTPIKVKKGDKPWLLTEFGGLSMRVENHTFNNKMFGYKIYKSKQTLTKAYRKLFEHVIIPQIDEALSATVYTQVTDVEDELNGIMTYDREINKIDVEILKQINSQVKL